MKKILATVSTIVTLFFVSHSITYSATVIDDFGSDRECVTTPPLPLESTWCSTAYTSLTYNNPSPAGNVLITLNEHYLHGPEIGVGWGYIECGGTSCSAGDIATDINGWGTVYGPSGGSVNPSLSAGTYNILLDAAPYSAGGVTCRWSGSSNCKIVDLGNSNGGTLTVTAAASVNLNIGMLLENLKAKVLALVPLVEKASAQTQAVATTAPRVTSILVADVNLTDAQIVRVSDNDYRVTFALTNKGELQEDVVYRVSFSDEKKKLVYTQVFDTVLALQKNRPAFINERLILPEGFSGTFDVYVHAFTKAGLPLGVGVAGKITLESNPVPTLSSCSINAKEYRTSETLPVTCVVSSPKPISSYDANGGGYVVVSRAFYGNEPLEKMKSSGEIISSKSTQSLRGFDTPGTYAIRTRLETRSGIPSGKEVVNTFTVNGTAARIMNIMLDKNSYERNEVAKGTLSASMFTTESGKLFKLKASLTGKSGLCARELEQELNRKSSLELFFDVDKRCVDPIFSVAITDERGNLLAQKSLGLTSEKLPMSSGAKALLAVVLLGVIAYLARHEKLVSYLKKKAKRKK